MSLISLPLVSSNEARVPNSMGIAAPLTHLPVLVPPPGEQPAVRRQCSGVPGAAADRHNASVTAVQGVGLHECGSHLRGKGEGSVQCTWMQNRAVPVNGASEGPSLKDKGNVHCTWMQNCAVLVNGARECWARGSWGFTSGSQ